jgi:hypothetical protein
MKNGALTGFWCVVWIMCGMVCHSWAQGEGQDRPSVFFPEPVYTFDAVYEGVSVPHEFVIQNKGPIDLEVKRVDGG